MLQPRLRVLRLFVVVTAAAGCSNSRPNADAGGMDATLDATSDAVDLVDGSTDADVPVAVPRLVATTVDTRFVTAAHMLASFEMQQSGEPLAQAMGRNLAGYDRNLLPPDMYTDPTGGPDGGPADPVKDLVGFATGIESYEYSKQPMNNLALEGGAGVPLLFGPLVNPSAQGGTNALSLLRTLTQSYALESHVGVRSAPGTTPTAYFVVPVPTDDPTNVLGWRGLWPTLVPYRGFDSAIQPVQGVSGVCSITPGDGDDGRGGVRANPVGDYECDYNTLHIARSGLDTTIGPGAAGWAAWKYALWVTNYLQTMHDVVGDAIGAVAPTDLANVGAETNTIVGTMSAIGGDPTMSGVAGTYIGSSDIEGFQAAMMITELDNAAQSWLTQWTTSDGVALGGFATTADALAYDYNAPLRWIPADIAVTETSDASGFPRPAYAVGDASSHLMDLLGLAGGYAQLYAVTDESNADVGGAQPARVYFDGDPFAHDDQTADGEATLHDRALALLKFIVVSIDRIHRDPASDQLVDDVTLTAGVPTRGTTLGTATAAYVITSLRTVRRTLGSHLTLYANSTPDTAVTSTPLDATSFAGAPGGANIAGRLTALIHADADLLYSHLTDANGNVAGGWDVASGSATDMRNDLESHAAAIDGLLDAFLATGDTRYRDRAVLVFSHMESTLWDPAVRMYRSAPVAASPIEFTPLRFALVERALREMYKLVGSQPGNGALASRLQSRIARLIKLVLNGWDDRNDDGTVDWPDECVNVMAGLPRGGLQMAERALTGELGTAGGMATSDRDHDCVPEIDDAQRPAALAADIRFDVQP